MPGGLPWAGIGDVGIGCLLQPMARRYMSNIGRGGRAMARSSITVDIVPLGACMYHVCMYLSIYLQIVHMPQKLAKVLTSTYRTRLIEIPIYSLLLTPYSLSLSLSPCLTLV